MQSAEVKNEQLRKENLLGMADFEDLLAYQKAFKLAMEVFEISKNFPVEEKYSAN